MSFSFFNFYGMKKIWYILGGIELLSITGFLFLSFNTQKTEVISQEESSLFNKNSLASLISETALAEFKNIPLDQEVCFTEYGDQENEITNIRCIHPNEANCDSINCEEILSEIKKLSYDTSLHQISDVEIFNQEGTKDIYLQNVIKEQDPQKYLETKTELITKCETGECGTDELQAVSFLASLEGEYEALEAYASENCEKFSQMCEKNVAVFITGTVTDAKDSPLEGVLVSVLGQNKNTFTNSQGEYSLEFSVYERTKFRLQVTKEGYATGSIPFEAYATDIKEDNVIFRMEEPEKIITINTISQTIENGSKVENGYKIETSQSVFILPFDAIVTEERIPYNGKVRMYAFEFDRSSSIERILVNDAFSDQVAYIGSMLETAGMPYLIFLGENNETLHISSDNPALLTYRIPEMQVVQEREQYSSAQDREAELEELVRISQESEENEYPLTQSFFMENGYLDIPLWWTLDQKTGVWRNIGFKFLDTKGLMQTTWYTLY
jgi:hypothetical protein